MGPVIDLTTLFPWRIIAVFAYSLSAYVIAHSCSKDKWHPFLTLLTIFAARIVTSVAFTDSNLNMLGYVVFALLYFVILCIFTYDSSVFSKIICSIFQILSYILSVLIMGFTYLFLYDNQDPQEILGTTNPNAEFLYFYLVRCIVMIVCGFAVAGIIRIIRAKKEKKQWRNKLLFAYLSFFPVSHIWVLILLFIVIPTDTERTYLVNTPLNVAIAMTMLLIMLFDCFYPFLIDRFEKLTLENEEKSKQLLKNEMDYQQTKMLSAEQNEFHKLRHDFSNLLVTAQGFIELGEPEKALQIIQKTQKQMRQVSGVPICVNQIIHVVLYIKQQKADELGVSLQMSVQESCVLKIDDYSVCRVMHNLLDNALDAAAKSPEKSVRVNVLADPQKFAVHVENSFAVTGRKNKPAAGHGYGLGIVQDIVRQHGGTYSAHVQNGLYCAGAEMPNISVAPAENK